MGHLIVILLFGIIIVHSVYSEEVNEGPPISFFIWPEWNKLYQTRYDFY